MIAAVSEREAESWDLAEGDEIAPGRSVLKPLGGGHVYEVYLVWDDHLFSLAVAKVLRPGARRTRTSWRTWARRRTCSARWRTR